MVFNPVLEASLPCTFCISPHLTHQFQIISSLIETARPDLGVSSTDAMLRHSHVSFFGVSQLPKSISDMVLCKLVAKHCHFTHSSLKQWFSNLSWRHPCPTHFECFPHLSHLFQIINSLIETARPYLGVSNKADNQTVQGRVPPGQVREPVP